MKERTGTMTAGSGRRSGVIGKALHCFAMQQFRLPSIQQSKTLSSREKGIFSV
jgi:hypothetical protein